MGLCYRLFVSFGVSCLFVSLRFRELFVCVFKLCLFDVKDFGICFRFFVYLGWFVRNLV